MRYTLIGSAFLLLVADAYAQLFYRLGDIHFGTQSSLVSVTQENQFAALTQHMLFGAWEEDYGHEPWVYDGDELQLLADIRPGEHGSGAKFFIGINDLVIFNASNDAYGWEWWATDGTPAGTHLLIDLRPGPENGVTINDWWEYYVFEGNVYFPGSNAGNNYELWKTNGTPEGTVLVKDIKENTGSDFSSHPGYFTEFKGKLFFSTAIGVYETDGTEAGTKLLTDEFLPTELIGLDEYLLMVEDDELIRSDGTQAGTTLLRDFASFTFWHNYLGPKFRRIGDFALFGADDAVHGHELWRSDGTPGGTYMVKDIHSGIYGSSPTHTTIFKGEYYFRAGDGIHGSELWKSDGTTDGTQMVKDIKPGSSSGFVERLFSSPSLDYLFLNAGNDSQTELWVTDGTEVGTYEIDINPDGSSSPAAFNAYGDKFFFYAITPQYGYEPYVLDPALLTATDDHAHKQNVIELYPNPTTGIVHIGGHVGVLDHYTVYTIDGVAIKSGNVGTQIDLSGMSNGVYLVEFQDAAMNKVGATSVIISRK